jgi:sporulation protein YlmC with PRC-barrel domain
MDIRPLRSPTLLVPVLGAVCLCATLLASAAPSVPVPAAHAPQLDERASRLIGNEIRDSRGWIIGEVLDFMVDPSNNRVTFMLLSAGGRFQANGTPLALALPSPLLHAEDDDVRVNATMKELQKLPTASSTLEDLDPAVSARLVSAKALMKADLRDASGRDVGGMQDLVLDLETGVFRYAVVDYDPSLLSAGKSVAVPKLNVRKAKEGSDDLVLVVDPVALASASGYENARWPDLGNDTLRGRMKRWINFN